MPEITNSSTTQDGVQARLREAIRTVGRKRDRRTAVPERDRLREIAVETEIEDARSVRFRALLTRAEKAEAEVARLKTDWEAVCAIADERKTMCWEAIHKGRALEAEVARLTEERDDWKATSELAGFPSNVAAQQREDIRRLLVAVEAVCAKACLTGRLGEGYSYQVGKDGNEELQGLADTLAEMKERYGG